MNHKIPKITPMGERSILISFDPEISVNILEKILFFKEIIEKNYLEGKVEVINTFHSLLINYQVAIENVYEEVLKIKSLLEETNISQKNKNHLYHLPVCYDREFGLDLDLISVEKKLSAEEIITLHTDTVYTVYFIGFLPGFLYLGGLDERLQISRKNQPRLKVQKGAVGIGEKQTGIYPKTSPGGWQIIGNSPVPLFNSFQHPPCEILAGDKVKFYQVSKKIFSEISKEVATGNFQFRKEEQNG